MSESRRVHLGAQYSGEDPHEVWHRDYLPSINTPSSYLATARTAREGLYDFYFQSETAAIGLAGGRIAEPNVLGRVDNTVTQAYLSGLVEEVGYVATINATNNSPLDIARRMHTLDALTDGRAGWNVVLGGNPLAYRNFRDIGDRSAIDRYVSAAEQIEVVRAYLETAPGERVQYRGEYFSVHAEPIGPPTRQGMPFTIVAGDSARSRDFAAKYADAMYMHYATDERGRPFYDDVKRRAVAHGRSPDDIQVMARLAVLVGDTDADAEELQRELLPYQLHPTIVRSHLETIWGVPIDQDFDPDGPLPDFDPAPGHVAQLGLSIGLNIDGPADRAVAYLRGIQERTGFGARRTIIAGSGTSLLAGGPETVANELIRRVADRVVDGFVFTPHITGSWLADFNRLVVPLLQEAGVYPTSYRDETLRERVGSTLL